MPFRFSFFFLKEGIYPKEEYLVNNRASGCGCDNLVSVMEHNDRSALMGRAGGRSPRSGADTGGPGPVGLLAVCPGQASPSPRASVSSSVERGCLEAFVKYDV